MNKFTDSVHSIVKKCIALLQVAGKKIRDTHSLVQIVSFSVLAVFFLLFFGALLSRPAERRSLFFFQDAATHRTRQEVRYIPSVQGLDARLGQYVEELLLGPVSPGLTPLFNRNSRVVDSFIRKSSAYINISAEALLPDAGVTSSQDAVKLFKKNVFTNFRNVDKIYLYIDGTEVYGERPDANAKLKK